MSPDPDVRRLALSCLLLGFVGNQPPGWLLDALTDGLAGVVLFGSNLGDGTRVDELTSKLRAAAGRDIVVALDEEGGDVTRLDSSRGSSSPGAAALGHLDDVTVTEQVYAGIGERLARAGITVNLAPVADVNTDPRNPVIGVRSFGTDPQHAARHVAAAVRGIQRAGVAACVKHFPGHGATSSDSHHEVATVARSLDELGDTELVPFRAAIEAGSRAVMTGHLMVPALDRENLATVSPAITRQLLRRQLGFTGTVLTDALEMRALSATIGMIGGFVQALAAGADAVESGALDYPELVEQVPLAVARALDEGRLDHDRLADAAHRTTALATLAPPPAGRAGDANPEADQCADPGTRADPTAAPAVAGCLEVIGTLPALERPLVVEARPPGGMASGELPWSVATPLAALVPGTEVVTVTAGSTPDLAQRASGRGLVVVVRDPDRHPWQRSLLDLARHHPAAVVVDVGWPATRPEGVAVIRTRGVAPGLLFAAAQRLAAR